MNPVANPEAYDVIILAGQRSPGVCKIGRPKREEGWDEQKPKGTDGAETVPTGRPLAKFGVEFKVWIEDDVDGFAEWETFAKLCTLPVKKGAEKALDIYHPQLAAIGVSSVVVKAWSAPEPDGKGGGVAFVDFLEYRPSKPKDASKPKGSEAAKKKAADGSDLPDPNQDKKDELKRLEDELRSGGPG